MSKVRINDLARELEVKSKAILDALPLVGVTEKKTHSSSLEDHEAEKVRAHIRGSAEAQSSVCASPRAHCAAKKKSKPRSICRTSLGPEMCCRRSRRRRKRGCAAGAASAQPRRRLPRSPWLAPPAVRSQLHRLPRPLVAATGSASSRRLAVRPWSAASRRRRPVAPPPVASAAATPLYRRSARCARASSAAPPAARSAFQHLPRPQAPRLLRVRQLRRSLPVRRNRLRRA